ncbi:MAG: heme-binding protein [Rhodocyclales bacterium GT-UBC]|nr:MAG: heme-binding protein [Rhodocyclales bacterium GT-UBC]
MNSFIKVLALLLGAASFSAHAQLVDRKALTLAEARKAIAAATDEAKKNNWSVVIAVVDDAGVVLTMDRLDHTARPSADIAVGKARTAALFRRPSGVMEESIGKGRAALLSAGDYVFLQGGVPIVVNGETIGGVGVSGAKPPEDEQLAKVGAAAVGQR